MSTTSTNFRLVLATTSDTVNVVTQIANNFSSLDSIISIAHTGTGELKSSLSLTNPVLINPTFSGTASGAGIVVASTGQFNTITATGGAITVNTLTVGTYGVPATIGNANDVLTVVTGNAKWVAVAPGTGAAGDLSNLASVAINTSLNTFTAGFVTVARVIATSGALTGLTSFQATAGTFAGALTALGTVNANVVNCTGGAITAGGISIGTYALPSTVGASAQYLKVVTANAVWASPVMTTHTAFFVTSVSGNTPVNSGTNFAIPFQTEVMDLGGNVTTGMFTAPTSGLYELSFMVPIAPQSTSAGFHVGILIATTTYALYSQKEVVSTGSAGGTVAHYAFGTLLNTVASGATVSVYVTISSAGSVVVSSTSPSGGWFSGKRLFEF